MNELIAQVKVQGDRNVGIRKFQIHRSNRAWSVFELLNIPESDAKTDTVADTQSWSQRIHESAVLVAPTD